jgi:hypothetical protein
MLTNKKNLNEAILRAVQKDWYSGTGEKRDYSVTQLLSPPKIIQLMRRHKNEIDEDVSERVFALMGSAMHAILERANEHDGEFILMSRLRSFLDWSKDNENSCSDDEINAKFMEFMVAQDSLSIAELVRLIKSDRYLIEKRFHYTTKSGKIVTGGIDLYDKQERTLHDYKFSSVWTWIYRNRPGSRIEEYTQQLNMYRLFMENMNIPVDKLRINLLFRDYSKSKAKQDYNYPDPIETIEIPMLGLDVVEQMIENKIAEIEKYNNVLDNGIPPCNSHERWQGQDTWAVRKKANKTASKVEFSYSGAKKWLEEEIAKLAEKDIAKGIDSGIAMQRASDLFVIEKRESQPVRCVDYCPVNKFCDYYQQLPEKVKNSND